MKSRHQSSIGLIESDNEVKESILNLYEKLDNKISPSDLLKSLDLPKDKIRVDWNGIKEQLSGVDQEEIIKSLKLISRLADQVGDESKYLLPIVKNLIKSHTDEEIRYNAVKVVGKLKDESAITDLLALIKYDRSERIKEGAIKAIGTIKAKGCFSLLLDIVSGIWDESIRVRKAAVYALGHIDPEESIDILCDTLVNDPDRDVRAESADVLSKCLLKLEKSKAATVANLIGTQIDHENEEAPEVRIAVIHCLTITESDDLVDRLVSVLANDPNPRVRGEAANSLAHFFDPRIEKALITRLEKEDAGIKKRIALALAQYAMKNPLGLHDEVCKALIQIQKTFPRGSYVWKEAIKALPAC